MLVTVARGNAEDYGDSYPYRVLCSTKGLHVNVKGIFLLNIVHFYRANMLYSGRVFS